MPLSEISYLVWRFFPAHYTANNLQCRENPDIRIFFFFQSLFLSTQTFVENLNDRKRPVLLLQMIAVKISVLDHFGTVPQQLAHLQW